MKMPLVLRAACLGTVLLAFTSGTAQATERSVYGFIGGWAYDIQGDITAGATLDFERDLGLRANDRKSYTLGYTPARFGWLPAIEFDYLRIAAEGMQTIPGVADGTPVQPVFDGIGVGAGTVVRDSADINDFELSARWPWQIGDFTLSGGINLIRLDGTVLVADANSGEESLQDFEQVFPLLSAAAVWQPTPVLRLSLRGDFIQYQDDRADALEAHVFWRFLGPVGLEAGYRQRRYKVVDGSDEINARLAGGRIGVRMEVPF